MSRRTSNLADNSLERSRLHAWRVYFDMLLRDDFDPDHVPTGLCIPHPRHDADRIVAREAAQLAAEVKAGLEAMKALRGDRQAAPDAIRLSMEDRQRLSSAAHAGERAAGKLHKLMGEHPDLLMHMPFTPREAWAW